MPTSEQPVVISPAAHMAALLTRKNIYAGTVPAATIAKRRARNKRARAARRLNRR